MAGVAEGWTKEMGGLADLAKNGTKPFGKVGRLSFWEVMFPGVIIYIHWDVFEFVLTPWVGWHRTSPEMGGVHSGGPDWARFWARQLDHNVRVFAAGVMHRWYGGAYIGHEELK